MNQRNAPEQREPQSGKPRVETPPATNRKHLTEPSWIEEMIHLTGVYLGQESDDADAEENPPKTEAA